MGGEKKPLPYDKVKELAAQVGQTPEAFAESKGIIIAGKQDGSSETTPPTEPEKTTAAGDSSLADTSLESPETSPYALTAEDIEGSEEKVRERLQQRLKAVGIDIEEAILGADFIKLTALDGTSETFGLTNGGRLDDINKFISQYADDTYAESLKEGRGEILTQLKDKISSVSVDDKDAEKWLIRSWDQKLAEKQRMEMRANRSTSSALTRGDFDTEEQYQQYANWKESGEVEMSPEEIKAAKSTVLEEEKNAVSKAFIRDLGDEDREAVEAIAAYDVMQMQERIKNFQGEIKSYEEAATKLQADIDAFNANPVSEEEAAALRARTAELLIQQDNINAFMTEMEGDDAQSLMRASADLAKNYSMLAKLGVNFKKTGLDIGYGAFQIVMATGSLFSGEGVQKGIDLSEEIARETIEDMNREVASYDEGVQFSRIGKDGNVIGDIANWAGNTATQAIPSLSLAFTGPAAMPLFFVSGYGGTAAEMATQQYEALTRIENNMKLLQEEGITPEEMAELNKAIEEDKKLANIPAGKQLTTSVIAGLAEVAFERLGTMSILKGVNATVSTSKKEIVKSILKSANQEGLTEAATELTNNWAKINIMGDEEVNLFDNVAESYFGGMLIGGPLELKHSMPAIYANISHSAMTSKELKDYQAKVGRLKKLTGIENLETLLNSRMPLPDGLSDETKRLIQEVQTEGELLQDAAVQRLQKRLSSAEITQLGELNMRMRHINKRLTDAARSGASHSEIHAIKEELEGQFNALSEQRDALLTNKATQAETARVKNNLNASIAFNEAAGIVFENERQARILDAGRMFDLLEESVRQEKLDAAGGNIAEAKKQFFYDNNRKQLEEDYNRAQQLNQENGNTVVIKRMTAEEFKKAAPDAKESEEAFFDPNTNEIFVNEDVAARNGRVGVYTHEMFHAIVKSTIGNGKANKAGENLMEYLKKEAGDVYSYIQNRLEALYTEDGKKDDAYYEEAMTALSDYIAEGNKIEMGALSQVHRFINKVLGTVAPSLEVNDGQQTFEFIVQYATKNRGEKAEAAIKSFIKSMMPDEEEAEATDKPAPRKASRSAIADRAAQKLAKVQEEGFDPNSMEVYEALNGMVSAQLAKYQAKGLKITDEEEAVSDIVARLYTQRDVNKFDGRGTLYGYLNGRIKFRILDAFKSNPIWVENFGEVDVDGLQGAAVQEVAVEAVDSTAIVEEVSNRPEYKNLLRRRVVSDEVVESIKSKIVRTVRLLKSPIDAKVSKNVTVVPIMREIKKEMGKQADIDLKTAMGGKKDGELRKFLLRNKAAILENMTTTYLSQAFPGAIQKKVDGVWTSDWKGKKIDRETTSTDKAGRTSGAELVRRLPKAAGAISDADFLANILQPDGNPIRGRKESLAKAIAEEISFDIINEALQDPNSEIYQALVENQQRLGVENAENIAPEFKRLSERGNVKFSRSIVIDINEAALDYELMQQSNVRGKMNITYKWLDKFIADNGLPERYDLNSKEGVKAYVEDLKKNIIPLMPKEFWFRGEDLYSPLFPSRSALKVSKTQFEYLRNYMFENIRDDASQKYGKRIEGVENFKSKSYDALLGNAAKARRNAENGEIAKANIQNARIHMEMWKRFAEAIAKDKNNARSIIMFMAASTNDMKHPQRMGATITGWSKTLGQNKVTYEHSFPNLAVIQGLMEAAVNQNEDFAKYYRYIASNYRVIALDKADDAKVNKAFKTKMPPKFDIVYGAWWDRYFNPVVSKIDGGIDPGSIELASGKTLKEVTGVGRDGRIRSEKIQEFLNKNGVDVKKIAARNAEWAQRHERGKQKYSRSFPPPQVLDSHFNKILERKKGVAASTTFSRIRAQLAGKGKGRFKFFIAPGADDFRGLVHYAFAGKGKQGEKDMEFFEKNLMEPYFRGIAAIDSIRQTIKREFKVVTKTFKDEYKMLSKKVGDGPFTYDHALRVYMWSSQGTPIPGISAEDQQMLENAILDNPQLADLAEALMVVGRRETWPKPSEFWEGDSVLADLNSMTEKVGRKEILEPFIKNAEAIFTEANLNKIEALYGRNHREAIEDSLYSMKNGTNRPSGANRQMNKWLNWINGSTGAIMFFNRRSALLQMLSFTNFINWSDNNPIKAAAAFANQKQYWKDFAFIFNSDKLKERRGGLKQDVSDSEIAQVAGKSKNSPQAILAYLLKIGFTPTQIADSLAIAMGGATFYRNRVNTYLKQGMTQKAAEEQAFFDFSQASDVAQQSSDPALVSKEQRSTLGRLVLAFANTPMQYTRLMKKAGLDLINGRGDWKTNVSKIAYYGFVQNFIFSALQGALFALAFDSDEEDEEKIAKDRDRRISRTIHSMLDTVLRGTGIYGAVASTIKNTIMQYYAQEAKGYSADHAYTLLSAAGISPPIGSKMRKVYGAIQTAKFEKDHMEARGWAVTADGKMNLGPNWSIAGSLLSGVANVPLDRVVDELKAVSEALDDRNRAWQRIALALGWKTWDVGARNEEADLIKTEAKEKRKEEGKRKAKETREKNKKDEKYQKAFKLLKSMGYTDEQATEHLKRGK